MNTDVAERGVCTSSDRRGVMRTTGDPDITLGDSTGMVGPVGV